MSEKGFTLIEVILASVIMAILGTLTFGALSTTFQTQKTISDRTVLQETGTAILSRIREDISQVFIVEAPRQITFFQGNSSPDQDKMTFTSMSHIRSGPNTHESDQAEITYDTETDSKGNGLYKLKRGENRNLTSDKSEPVESIVLTDRLLSFKLEYGDGDGDEYQSKWDSKSSDQRNKLPKTVRVALKLKDEKEREETYEAVIEIPLAEELGVNQNSAALPTPTPTPTGGHP